MAKITFPDFNNYVEAISRIYTSDIISGAIYEGAGVVADKIKNEIKSLPIENGMGSETKKLSGISAKQKSGLIDGLGISKKFVQNGGSYHKIGFAGYNSLTTKLYPNGQPNALIARSVIKGTSFRKKNNFVQRAVLKSKSECESKMRENVDENIKKLMEG